MPQNTSEQQEQNKPAEETQPEKLQNQIGSDEQESENLSEEELKEVNGGLIGLRIRPL